MSKPSEKAQTPKKPLLEKIATGSFLFVGRSFIDSKGTRSTWLVSPKNNQRVSVQTSMLEKSKLKLGDFVRATFGAEKDAIKGLKKEEYQNKKIVNNIKVEGDVAYIPVTGTVCSKNNMFIFEIDGFSSALYAGTDDLKPGDKHDIEISVLSDPYSSDKFSDKALQFGARLKKEKGLSTEMNEMDIKDKKEKVKKEVKEEASSPSLSSEENGKQTSGTTSSPTRSVTAFVVKIMKQSEEENQYQLWVTTKGKEGIFTSTKKLDLLDAFTGNFEENVNMINRSNKMFFFQKNDIFECTKYIKAVKNPIKNRVVKNNRVFLCVTVKQVTEKRTQEPVASAEYFPKIVGSEAVKVDDKLDKEISIQFKKHTYGYRWTAVKKPK
ncbi:hypothetical protein CRE_15795 [Caenorhabditis remanei]|uniref:Uncharacterized protein n=1 Tax=Caenorhabditis remanei TaxID=31234 RepID=E3NLM5_CAERE|nr:hypothetical protein CRE_15795 [Caenorhabditis remanei]